MNSPVETIAQDMDREFRAQVAKVTSGLAPSAFTAAWTDWATQLAVSPARRHEIRRRALERAGDTWAFALRASTGATLSPREGMAAAGSDHRFDAAPWWQFPFNVYARAYQNHAALLKEAIQGVGGVSEYHRQLVEFTVRILLDSSSPANFLATNPELLALTRDEQGANLLRGLENLLEDVERALKGAAPAGTDNFQLGRDLAVTPGQVIFRNELIELLQYEPATSEVHAEPILIVPAWIMKYYILDLSARNSLVRYLVEQGHTVFMISWKNPDERDREFSIEDYVEMGFRAALDAVTAVVPDRRVHSVGYCIGGTLLAIGAAAAARARDERVASITLFAAQTDFTEPGELAFFINPSQLAMLEATMSKHGVLDSKQMGGAFAMLRARELVWQPIVDTYLKGRRAPMVDLMAWNADGTRMPARMHTEYLYRLYLDNELATNRFPLGAQRVRLSDLRVPMFVVGTESDHVAPWRSVYKIGNLVRSDDLTFLLTSGGHNAGIVCGPVHPRRHYRARMRRLADPHLAPEEFIEETTEQPGSWWPAWQQWLAGHSSQARVPPPEMGAPARGCRPLAPAPGGYVRQR